VDTLIAENKPLRTQSQAIEEIENERITEPAQLCFGDRCRDSWHKLHHPAREQFELCQHQCYIVSFAIRFNKRDETRSGLGSSHASSAERLV
jgi:hypothetical protein